MLRVVPVYGFPAVSAPKHHTNPLSVFSLAFLLATRIFTGISIEIQLPVSEVCMVDYLFLALTKTRVTQCSVLLLAIKYTRTATETVESASKEGRRTMKWEQEWYPITGLFE